MARPACPWWLGYLLASPLRRLMHDPAKILAPYVHEGMTVLEPGPGMGFFTLELARLVGPRGRVITVDVQPQMIDGLKRRADKAGLLDRIECRVVSPDSMALLDLVGSIDFTLAFALVHEMPSASSFFGETAAASKARARILFAEPSGHVKDALFGAELDAAFHAGFLLEDRPPIRHCKTALLRKG
jgi:SAM-dependent methyltransferase